MSKVIGKVVFGNKVVVSDPCYDIDTVPSGGIILASAPGEWSVRVGYGEEGRVSSLVATKTGKNTGATPLRRVCTAGVDSGQMSIVDFDAYPKGDDTGDYDNPDTFYGEVCALTLHQKQCGITRDGKAAVSSSGWGDGEYPVKAKFNAAGEAVHIQVMFMGRGW
jgi:hypothetical protein